MAETPAFSAQQIHRVRTVGLWSVRTIAAALITYGIYLFLKRMIFGVMIGDPAMPFQVHMEIGETHSTSRGPAMAIVGLAMFLLSRRMMGWVFPPPFAGCPRCAYPVPEGMDGSSPDRCPECGYQTT